MEPAVVLSEPFWRATFAADPAIVDKRLTLNGTSFRIVGVTEAGFFGLDPSHAPDVLVPIGMLHIASAGGPGVLETQANWSICRIVGRLRRGVSDDEARTAAHAAMLQSVTTTPNWPPRGRVYDWPRLSIVSIDRGLEGLRASATQPMLIVSAVVAMLLLIAVANVAGLLVARGVARRARGRDPSRARRRPVAGVAAVSRRSRGAGRHGRRRRFRAVVRCLAVDPEPPGPARAHVQCGPARPWGVGRPRPPRARPVARRHAPRGHAVRLVARVASGARRPDAGLAGAAADLGARPGGAWWGCVRGRPGGFGDGVSSLVPRCCVQPLSTCRRATWGSQPTACFTYDVEPRGGGLRTGSNGLSAGDMSRRRAAIFQDVVTHLALTPGVVSASASIHRRSPTTRAQARPTNRMSRARRSSTIRRARARASLHSSSHRVFSARFSCRFFVGGTSNGPIGRWDVNASRL